MEGGEEDVGVCFVGGDDDKVFAGLEGVKEGVDLAGDGGFLTIIFYQSIVEVREQFVLHLGQESFHVLVGNGSFVGEPAVVGAEVRAQAFGWFGFVGLGGRCLLALTFNVAPAASDGETESVQCNQEVTLDFFDGGFHNILGGDASSDAADFFVQFPRRDGLDRKG